MATKKYIHPESVFRSPIGMTLLLYLFLKDIDANAYVWGATGLVVALSWAGAIVNLWNCTFVKLKELA